MHWAIKNMSHILHALGSTSWGKKRQSENQTHVLVPDHPTVQWSGTKTRTLVDDAKINKAVAYAGVQQDSLFYLLRHDCWLN